MSIDVYEQISVMESDKFLLREIKDSDVLYTHMKGRGCRVISDDKIMVYTSL